MSAQWPGAVSTAANLYTTVNLLQTTLSGTITSGVTTITLTSTSGFPTAGAVTIDNEVIFYTGISGANLTGCTRGADGTTAASHNSGVPVGATVVAYHVNSLNAEVIAIETDLHSRFGFGSSAISVPSGVSFSVASTITGTKSSGTSLAINTTDLVVDSTNHRVGVGTSPSAPLHVVGNSTSTAGLAAAYFNDSIGEVGTALAIPHAQLIISPSSGGDAGWALMAREDAHGYEFGNQAGIRMFSGSATATTTYDAKDTTERYFHLNSDPFGADKMPVPGTTFTISGVTYTVRAYRPANSRLFVYEDNTGAASSGTLTSVSYASTAIRVDTTQHALFSDGTSGLPGVSWLNDTDTGIFRVGANEIGVSCGGTQVLDITTTWLGIMDGTVSRPGLLFQSDPGTGFYRLGAGDVGLAISGGQSIDFQLGTTNFGGVTSPNLYITSSSASGVQLRFLASTTSAGYIQTQSNHPLHFTTNNGVDALVINTSQQVEIPNTKLRIGPTGSSNQAYPIVQIVTGTSTTLFSTTSSTFQTTNLSVSITPKFSTSKIYVIATGSMGDSSTSKVVQATIARSGTNVLGTGGGAVWNVSIAGILPVTIQAYDSPGTTSAITYAVQVRNFDGASTVNWGGGTSPELTQYITAMEIAQ